MDKYGLKEILLKYKQNMDRQRELDEKLLDVMDKDAWKMHLINRASETQRMFTENGELIDSLLAVLEQPMDYELAALLYEECYSMYFDGYDDCQVLLPMVYKLINFYEEKQDIPKIIFLYGVAFYEENEIQGRREGEKKPDEGYNLKILKYKDRYKELDNSTRRRIWGAYYNIVISGFGNMALSAEASYGYLKELLEFWNSTDVQDLDGDSEQFAGIIKRIRLEWLIVEDGIEDAPQEVKDYFCKVAEELFIEEMQHADSVYEVNSEMYCAYLHARKLAGEISVDEIVGVLFDYYKVKLKDCHVGPDITEEEAYFLINTPLTLERWISLGGETDKGREIMEFLKLQTKATWFYNFSDLALPFINGVLAEWCFKLLKYMHSQEEKEECLYNLLVKKQLPTYLHSEMVMHLADALCKEAMRVRPEIFDSLEESVRSNLPEFVKKSALLHDVGKCQITDIINTQGRRLWDREFAGIKKHPSFGSAMLETDELLMQYCDIVKGHHKFYDGSSGYPADFDNTASPYRVIIDLITICDCMDAATDLYGRNYKRTKTMEAVLAEFVAGKGTRYNPDLVEVIENSPELQKEMAHIVNEGRIDIMYEAYRGKMA
ncbi:MAG: HD domain-containing protein [Lachnospiraceae bacterium]|nr:HD domain-containing protein [Lachnospiraceae bacterium]